MSQTRLSMSDGAQILLRRHGIPGKPCLLVSHGVGFAVDAFARMWRPLCRDFDVFVFDLRHHGRNPACDPMSIDAERQNRDMEEVVGAVASLAGDAPVWGLFHSISALAALRVEIRNPGTFAGLVLMEPPAPPPCDHPVRANFEIARKALAGRSARRQRHFETFDELASKYRRQPAFSRFVEGAGDDLARAALHEVAQGLELSCSPEAESRFYATNHDDGLYQRIGDVSCRLLFLAGQDDLAHAGSPAQVSRELAGLGRHDYAELAGASHMMPLERPDYIAALTRAFVIG